MVAYPNVQAWLIALDERFVVGKAEVNCTPAMAHAKSENLMPVTVEKKVRRGERNVGRCEKKVQRDQKKVQRRCYLEQVIFLNIVTRLPF